jgi:hypothetical protein
MISALRCAGFWKRTKSMKRSEKTKEKMKKEQCRTMAATLKGQGFLER